MALVGSVASAPAIDVEVVGAALPFSPPAATQAAVAAAEAAVARAASAAAAAPPDLPSQVNDHTKTLSHQQKLIELLTGRIEHVEALLGAVLEQFSVNGHPGGRLVRTATSPARRISAPSISGSAATTPDARLFTSAPQPAVAAQWLPRATPTRIQLTPHFIQVPAAAEAAPPSEPVAFSANTAGNSATVAAHPAAFVAAPGQSSVGDTSPRRGSRLVRTATSPVQRISTSPVTGGSAASPEVRVLTAAAPQPAIAATWLSRTTPTRIQLTPHFVQAPVAAEAGAPSEAATAAGKSATAAAPAAAVVEAPNQSSMGGDSPRRGGRLLSPRDGNGAAVRSASRDSAAGGGGILRAQSADAGQRRKRCGLCVQTPAPLARVVHGMAGTVRHATSAVHSVASRARSAPSRISREKADDSPSTPSPRTGNGNGVATHAAQAAKAAAATAASLASTAPAPTPTPPASSNPQRVVAKAPAARVSIEPSTSPAKTAGLGDTSAQANDHPDGRERRRVVPATPKHNRRVETDYIGTTPHVVLSLSSDQQDFWRKSGLPAGHGVGQGARTIPSSATSLPTRRPAGTPLVAAPPGGGGVFVATANAAAVNAACRASPRRVAGVASPVPGGVLTPAAPAPACCAAMPASSAAAAAAAAAVGVTTPRHAAPPVLKR